MPHSATSPTFHHQHQVQEKIQVVPPGEAKLHEAYARLGLSLEHVPVVFGGKLQQWPITPDARSSAP